MHLHRAQKHRGEDRGVGGGMQNGRKEAAAQIPGAPEPESRGHSWGVSRCRESGRDAGPRK